MKPAKAQPQILKFLDIKILRISKLIVAGQGKAEQHIAGILNFSLVSTEPKFDVSTGVFTC